MKYLSYWTKMGGGWHLFVKSDSPGEITDFVVWSEQLTHKEINALSKGARPNQVVPKKLLEWLLTSRRE